MYSLSIIAPVRPDSRPSGLGTASPVGGVLSLLIVDVLADLVPTQGYVACNGTYEKLSRDGDTVIGEETAC